MWFDIGVIVGAIALNICLFLIGLKVDKKREVLKWTLLITTWYSLTGNAILCWLLPLLYLSNGILWEEILKWSLRYGAMGMAVYYYLLPLFKGAVEPNQVGARKFLWDPNGRILKNLKPGWYYYIPLLFGLFKASAEIEKVEISIPEVLSKRARRQLPELKDRIMLDKAVLSVRYRVVDLKKLIPKMGRRKAEDYIRDEAISLLRAQIGIRSLAATLDGWKAIEKTVKKEMLLFENFGVRIVTVLIHNLKVIHTENKKEEGRETKKEKQNTSDDSEDDADKVEKKKGFAGVVVGIIVVLIIAAITVPIVTSAIKDVHLTQKSETPKKVTEFYRPKVETQKVEKLMVRKFRISADRRWTRTVCFKGGEKIRVVAKGTWDGSGSDAVEPDLPCGPEGIVPPKWVEDLSPYPYQGGRIHELLGKTERGRLFSVGSSYEGVVEFPGWFYLGINDWKVSDNDGYLEVTIEVVR